MNLAASINLANYFILSSKREKSIIIIIISFTKKEKNDKINAHSPP